MKKVITIVVIVLCIALGGSMVFSLFKKSKYKNSELTQFSYTYGGNMNGNSYDTEITAYGDDKAVIEVRKMEYYFQQPAVKEYVVDKAVFKDIKKIFDKYNMESYDRKTFEEEVVLDGETASYHFYFDGKYDGVWFSAQIFPLKISKQLSEIEDVIDSYIEKGELLPAFNPELADYDKSMEYDSYEKDKLVLQICYINHTRISYRYANGFDVEKENSSSCKLVDANGNVIVDKTSDSNDYIDSNGISYDHAVRLKAPLEKGDYVLTVGELSVEFTMK